mmetsp:Transcript_59194/g.117296  ORF Transcript_59194/g.117296 Transcript_59194/m.117296 type:complete len:107 (+) Transcript_59194:116-436(+)
MLCLYVKVNSNVVDNPQETCVQRCTRNLCAKVNLNIVHNPRETTSRADGQNHLRKKKFWKSKKTSSQVMNYGSSTEVHELIIYTFHRREKRTLQQHRAQQPWLPPI